MSFAMSIPDWNSLDSVRRAHSDLEAVALGFFALLVLFDVLAHLSKDEIRKTLLEKIALCFFAVAVLAEIIAYPYGQRNDALSAQVIGSLDIKAQRAADNASKALADSSTALTQSGQAITNAGLAGSTASTAKGEAGTAKSLASDAKAKALEAGMRVRSVESEAASLSRDIASVQEATKRLKARRELQNVPDIITALKAFKGTEYRFNDVYPDDESQDFLAQIDQILQQAEWKRMPSPQSDITLNPLKTGEMRVPMGTALGLRIWADIGEHGEYWASPTEFIKAAAALQKQVSDHIFPPETDKEGLMYRVTLTQGNSPIVRISVGKKP